MMSRSRIVVHAAHAVLMILITFYPAAALPREQAGTQTQAPPAETAEKAMDAQGQAAEPAQAAPEEPTAGQPAELTVPAPAAPEAVPSVAAPETPTRYTIKRGDTLWDITNAFFRDPFLWPLVWKSNPGITNPDLIYPGQVIVIPALGAVERALRAPEEAAPAPARAEEELPLRKRPAEAASPEAEEPRKSVILLPEEAPVPVMDKYSMLNAGYVDAEESDDEIIGAVDGKRIMGYDDLVYIVIRSREHVDVGDRFLMYQPLHDVEHPVTGEDYGTLIRVLGVLRVAEKGSSGTYTARITLSFDAAEKGTLLAPYVEPALIYDSREKRQKTLSGYILEVTDRRSINAQTDIVYLDKGMADGVEAGDRFLVYGEPDEPDAAARVMGEVQVIVVKERTATAVVRKSIDVLVKGERVEYKN
jgi:LysM repeat protein